MSHKFCVNTRTLRCSKEEITAAGKKIAISGSVGRGGINRPSDVRSIQQALNQVSLDEGGPLLGLIVDGIVGPRTIEAIERFQHRQLGWADGRVDTNKQTIAALNAVLGGGAEDPVVKVGGGGGLGLAKKPAPKPVPKPPNIDPNPYIPMLIAQMMPDVLGCIHAAQTNLLSLRVVLMNNQHTSIPWFNAKKLAMPLQRHFHIFKAKDVQGAINDILHVYNLIARALARGIGSRYFEAAQRNRKDWLCYTTMGGYVLGGRVDQQDVESPRLDTIYVCPAWLGMNYEWRLHLLIHELAHFCGPVNGPGAIDDFAHLADGPQYYRLKHTDAIRNAECYGLYAYHAKYGRDPVAITEKPEF